MCLCVCVLDLLCCAHRDVQTEAEREQMQREVVRSMVGRLKYERRGGGIAEQGSKHRGRVESHTGDVLPGDKRQRIAGMIRRRERRMQE